MTVTISGTDGISTPPIIVQGSTSGGITLAAPAVAGTNTQTLVAATGTLAPLISGTAQTAPFANTSSIDFTGIPSWVKRITVMINGLSYAAAGVGGIQIGSGSLTTTGYTSNALNFSITPGINSTTQTNGFGVLNTSAAASTVNGLYIITNITGNTWSFSEQMYRTSENSSAMSNGFIALGGVLDRLSLVATTSTFDAGTVNIMWE